MIVHDDRKLVRRPAIRLPDHEVPQVPRDVARLLSGTSVEERIASFGLDAEPPGIRTVGDPLRITRAAAGARSGIDRSLLADVPRTSERLQVQG
jgi:hypothetical protein